MDISPLIAHFSKYLPLNAHEIEVLNSMVEVKKVKRKQFILQQGDLCKCYSFVASGCFKMYKVDEMGKEHNIDFSIENQWLVDIDSFHNDKPSELYIEAMEAGEIFQIKKKDLLSDSLQLYLNRKPYTD